MPACAIFRSMGSTWFCNGCDTEKDLSFFYIRKRGRKKGRPVSQCKDCTKKQVRKWAAAHTEQRAAYCAGWYKRNAVSERKKTREYNRTHLAERVVRQRDYMRRLKIRDPQMYKAIHHRAGLARRARQHNLPRSATQAQIEARRAMWGGLCWRCKGKAREMDHVKPVVAGGAHFPCNLRPICRNCNARKKDKWPLSQEFLRCRF